MLGVNFYFDFRRKKKDIILKGIIIVKVKINFLNKIIF